MANTLKPMRLIPLPLGSITPEGWLKQQLIIQKNGLSGHLEDFWKDIKNSGWIGGKAEGWERAPYWLDGFIPLAFLLDNPTMIERAHFWINAILDSQEKNGWAGPVYDPCGYDYDPWPLFIVCKAMTQYYDATEDKRVLGFLEKFFQFLKNDLPRRILRSWGRYRWADALVSIHWLYDKNNEPWLLELADLIYQQGFKWISYYQEMPIKEKIIRPEMSLDNHVVNCAMSVKAPLVAYRQTHKDNDKKGTDFIINQLEKYHGQATGVFSGDEHLAGLSPAQGTELCAVVEYMYSLEIAGAISGKTAFFDRLEMIAYNALPATISPDMWSHQYDQQVNQVQAIITTDNSWTTNGYDSSIFGLEPNFGCCTANMHQGWPKLTSHLWMYNQNGGASLCVWAPCQVKLIIQNKPIIVTVQTNYPFSGNAEITLNIPEEMTFPLEFRIPQWANEKHISATLNDQPLKGMKSGEFYKIHQKWPTGKQTITFQFPMALRWKHRYNNAVSLYYGPIMMALKIKEQWTKITPYNTPWSDWEVRPLSSWNYALALDDLENVLVKEEKHWEKSPFNTQTPPLTLIINGYKLHNWIMKHNAAIPLSAKQISDYEKAEEITLIPYGATNLRIGEFPLISSSLTKNNTEF